MRSQIARMLLLLLGVGLLLSSCGEGPIPSLTDSEDKTAANDYMPFLNNGFLLRWQQNSAMRILLPDAASVTGGNATMDDSFQAGVAEWNAVLADLGITVSYVTSGDNEVLVRWDDGSGLPNNAVGQANYQPGNSPSRFIIMGTLFRSSSAIQATAAHEFGHMLGIWNHSFDPADRMYTSSASSDGVGSRDRATMRYLYNFSPDADLSAAGINSEIAADSGVEGETYIRATLGFDPANTVIESAFPAGMIPKHPNLR